MVKQKEIAWHVFVKLMEDFSYSDVNRLKYLNEILLTELTPTYSDIDRLKYLSIILITKFKDSIEMRENGQLDISQSFDYALNDEITEELSSNSEIQTSNVSKNKGTENLYLKINEDQGDDLNNEVTEELPSDSKIQTSTVCKNERKENVDSILNENLPNQTIFHCNICDKKYDHVHLKKNIRNANEKKIQCESSNGKGKIEQKCETCGKSFSAVKSLSRHIRTVHARCKVYNCESCGKSFSRAEHLKIHIHAVHEGNKDYNCEFCGKSFSRTANLKRLQMRMLR